MRNKVLAFVLAAAAITMTISVAPHSTVVAASQALPSTDLAMTAAAPLPSVVQMVPVLVIGAVFLYLCFFPDALVRLVRLATLEHGLMFQRINLTDPEKIFVVAYNSYSTAALSNGQAVIWDFATDADGVGVTRPTARATNAGFAVAGIAADAIAAGARGLIQVYGYHSAVRMRTVTGGTPAITAGRPLAINVAGSLFCLESMSTASKQVVVFPCAFALGATSGFTTAARAAFIKAL